MQPANEVKPCTAGPAYWFERYRKRLLEDTALLNALHAWMRADNERAPLFRELSHREVTAQELRAYGIPLAGELPRPAAVALPELDSPLSTDPDARAAAAWRWVHCLQASGGGADYMLALAYWIQQDRTRENDYVQLSRRWVALLQMKMLHIVVGMPTAPLPDSATLTHSELESLVLEEERINRQWRRNQMHELQQELLYQSSAVPLLIQNNAFSKYVLDQHSRAHIAFTTSQRRINLLAGRIFVDVFPLGAPFVLHAETLCVSGDAQCCCVRISAPWHVEITVLRGHLRVVSTRIARLDLQLQGGEQVTIDVRQGSCNTQRERPGDLEQWVYRAERATTAQPHHSEHTAQALIFIANQAARRVRDLGKTASSWPALTELGNWLQADDRHFQQFRAALDAQIPTQPLMPLPQAQWQDFAARSALVLLPDEALGHFRMRGVPSTPPLHAATGEDESAADLEALAWRWLQKFMAAPLDSELRGALIAWLRRDARHRNAYYPLAAQWVYLSIAKLAVLVAGLESDALPELAALQPAQLRALAAQVGEEFAAVRRLRMAHPQILPLRAARELGSHFNLPDNSVYLLTPDSGIDVQYTAGTRRIHHISGAVRAVLLPSPHWPFELRSGELCVRGDFAIFVVEGSASAMIGVYCQFGELTVSWPRGAGEPEQRTLRSGEYFELHGVKGRMLTLSDNDIH